MTPMRANTEWLLQLEVMAEHLPESKEGWVKLLITRSVLKELIQELQCIYDKEFK